MHSCSSRRANHVLCGLSVLASIVGVPTKTVADERAAVRTIQSVIDEVRGQLGLPAEVTASIVPTNELLVSVQPISGRSGFEIAFQESFLAGLEADELRTIVAHELGHVWIFTHHPYLQTERGANNVAMRVVSRENLERVYAKVFANRGVKGDLAKFLPPLH